MLIDTQRIQSGRVIRADVCIAGAGAAGIAIARALSSQGVSVCLLESGGLDFDEDHQSLYEGQLDSSIPPRNPSYLTRSRLRYFGGSTNHWNGWCRPLDELDFSVRSWVPDSRWPIGRSELIPYYDRAAELVAIVPFDDSRDEGLEWAPQFVLLDDPSFLWKRFHYSPPTRFGSRYRTELAEASNVEVHLHANVVGIDADETGSRVKRIRARTLTGIDVEVAATYYVLAAGGIENARLLLISDGVHKSGLGNDRDVVGRYFMEHPHLDSAGYVVLTDALPQPRVYGRRERMRAVLCPSEALQREYQLLNLCITFNFRSRRRTSSMDHLKAAVSDLDRLGADSSNGRGDWSGLFVRAEQSPNPRSRVKLADELDPLGMRRVELVWQMTERDIGSIRRALEVLGLKLGQAGRGRVRVNIREMDPWIGVGGGSHHMGTTRMSDHASRGVVDADCRVHGLANLFVAGSSVFPTVGFANPTFTVVALALRLAEHLAVTLKDA